MLFPSGNRTSVVRSSFLPRLQGIAPGRRLRCGNPRRPNPGFPVQRTTAEGVPRQTGRRSTGRRSYTLHAARHPLGIPTDHLGGHRNPTAAARPGPAILPQQLAPLLVVLLLLNLCTASRSFVALHNATSALASRPDQTRQLQVDVPVVVPVVVTAQR